MTQVTISGKVVGKSQAAFADWEISLPAIASAPPLTLRDLLAQIVRTEVEAFQTRQQERRLIKVLSPAQINLGMIQGKIHSGGNELEQVVDPGVAVETALQAFVDGLYAVFINDEQQMNLDQVIVLEPQSQLLFLRLVPLVGG